MDIDKELDANTASRKNIAGRVQQLRAQMGVLMEEDMKLVGEARILNKLKEEQTNGDTKETLPRE